MKSLQPYNSGNAFKLTHLWRLNRLWNIDKHRHIILHAVILDIKFDNLPAAMSPIMEIVGDYGVMRFPLASKPYVKLNPPPKLSVQFGHEAEGIILEMRDFFEMYEYIRDKVIPRFTGFFT